MRLLGEDISGRNPRDAFDGIYVRLGRLREAMPVDLTKHLFGAGHCRTEVGLATDVGGEVIRRSENFVSVSHVGSHDGDGGDVCVYHVVWVWFGLPADVARKGERTDCAALGGSVAGSERSL
jgi:hypothetical protein